MNKYTAEDFANARFAEHADGRTAARLHPNEEGPWESAIDYYDDAELARGGWVPVPAKPTMTRGEYEDATRNLNAGDWPVFDYALHVAGVEVATTPAPEPTNAEKLADVYREWYGGDEVPASLIRFMDAAGVTAPEEK